MIYKRYENVTHRRRIVKEQFLMGVCETWTWDVVSDVVPDVDEDAVQMEGMQDVDDLGDAVQRRRHELSDRHEL